MAKRIFIPVEESSDNSKTLLMEGIKSLELKPDESVMLYFTPNQKIATIYVFKELQEVAIWLLQDRLTVEPKEPKPEVSVHVVGDTHTNENIKFGDDVKEKEESWKENYFSHSTMA